MGGLIWLVILIAIIVKVMGDASKQKTAKPNVPRGNQGSEMLRELQKTINASETLREVQKTIHSSGTMRDQKQAAGEGIQIQERERRTMTEEDRRKLEEYRSRKNAKSNQNLTENQQRQQTQPDIVSRAKSNSYKTAGVDTTLEEMELEHGHSEHVGSAVAGYVERERAEHLAYHENGAPHVEEESYLGTIEDLMVKGFDGNLSFERDFVGEAEEMITSFTL